MPVLSKVIGNGEMMKITNDFLRLGDKCYLDNAGAALYPESLLSMFNEDLLKNLYVNPHTDKYTRDCIDQVRTKILRHFNVDNSDYTVIFTSGSTQSLKTVAESFQFAADENEVLNCGSFLYLQDNHTSVLGLREIAEQKHADIIHLSHDEFINTFESKEDQSYWCDKYKNEGNTLVAFPAQSNFNGYKYSLNYIDKIKNGCLNNYISKHLGKINCNWYILLDAASYVSTNKLDLNIYKPEFVCMSFYKVFGFPTGLGALLVKNGSEYLLSGKKYFGGGTVDVVISSENFHVKRRNLSERFEDGTMAFLSIVALKHCFDLMYKLIPKTVNNDCMETISHHTFYLAKDLYKQMNSLQHPNGRKAVVFYNDTEFENISSQGGIVTFNLVRSDYSYIGYSEFQHMADLFNITIRTGCFCNSGSCQRHLQLTNAELKEMYKAGHKCGDEVDLLFGKPTGCVRVSFGYHNTFIDVDKFVAMICKCFVKTKTSRPKRFTITYKNSQETVDNHVQKSNLYRNVVHRSVKINRSDPDSFESSSKIMLTDIAIYPIKSCGPFKVNSNWKIGPKGFEYDREWMIVKDNGVCLTQKHNTKMCMIHPNIDLKNKLLTLYFQDHDPITIPLENTANNCKNVSICQSKVCADTIKAYDCGDEVANWLSEALEVSFLRLIRQANEDERSIKSNRKQDRLKLLSLSNQAQYLLINRATVRWLRDKIHDDSFSESVDSLADRFRSNLIIDTETELVEREWEKIIIGKHEFKVEGMCSRCQMVCIDQRTGEKTVEPLRTISELFKGKMKFGIYLSYVGPVDGSMDTVLKTFSTVTPIHSDDISR